jgi:hypothetical protein
MSARISIARPDPTNSFAPRRVYASASRKRLGSLVAWYTPGTPSRNFPGCGSQGILRVIATNAIVRLPYSSTDEAIRPVIAKALRTVRGWTVAETGGAR